MADAVFGNIFLVETGEVHDLGAMSMYSSSRLGLEVLTVIYF